ncbi:fumarylacetoacetate hydrolase family protein [Rhodococcus sovatensis]|uniref:Fumarylacetoacetate hydrolase family protein n=1 Tax=Rhodococcus sovatensis TaxID=1805840 RepID=A0ABZ2PLV4_9NOCA
MKYARIDVAGTERVALVETAGVEHNLTLFPIGTDLLIAACEHQVPPTDAPVVALSDVRLRAPLMPRSFRDFVSFEEHVVGASAMTADPASAVELWHEQPTYLYGSPHAIIDPGYPVAGLPASSQLDFELEVGIVIGKDGRDLTPAEASDHIAGYLIVNDWSARDVQKHEMRGGLGPAKSKDFATTIGPWLVTPDELEDCRVGDRLDLRMSVFVNDSEFGSDNLAHMGWSFEELVSYASRGAWVRSGDLIASGTCAGGSLAEAWGRSGALDPPPLSPGDVVAMKVDRLGFFSNPVVAPPAERYKTVAATPLRDLHTLTGTTK